jgi:hypothetical protein
LLANGLGHKNILAHFSTMRTYHARVCAGPLQQVKQRFSSEDDALHHGQQDDEEGKPEAAISPHFTLGRIGYWQKKLGSRSDQITPHLLAEHHGVENELKSAMSVEEVLEAA